MVTLFDKEEEKKMGKIRSRRLNQQEQDEIIYCRKCTLQKPPSEFYDSPDKLLDTNGKLSVCKSCVNDIFNGFMISTNSSLSESINKTCKILNIYYSSKSVESLKAHIETLGDKALEKNLFGMYKIHLARFLSLNQGINGTYEFDGSYVRPSDEDALVNENSEYKKELYNFWGTGLEWEDYQFLENELAQWKTTHKHDTRSELIFLREIAFILLDIKKARESGQSTSTLMKQFQETVKTAGLDPANASAITGAQETFGNWIKEIETKTPAEWYENDKLFKDVDNLSKYWENYVTRPLKNFITGSRDFNISEASEEGEDSPELDLSSASSDGDYGIDIIGDSNDGDN
jgi:hypothetical protein